MMLSKPLLCMLALVLTCPAYAIKVLLPLVPEATSHQFQLLTLHKEILSRGHEVLVSGFPTLVLLCVTEFLQLAVGNSYLNNGLIQECVAYVIA